MKDQTPSAALCRIFLFTAALSLAAPARADDVRSKPLKDLNGYFPFTVPESVEAWKPRAEEVRQRIRVAVGLHPEPERTPLNAVIHGRREFDGYSVEKVYFESMPGFYVTGNLFRPLGLTDGQKVPGVLSPHGHFPEGRFGRSSDAAVKQSIESGAEVFESNARNVMQARCVQLARMGCTTFLIDMIGYADSRQISYELAHRFAKQRAEMANTESWGLFSPQAESHLQSVMGLQTWNAVRALDFLESLPEVDKSRLAVTGASGGGTQTFLLSAIDPRVSVSFPAVMVSTAMQGGCTCENASLLRIDTGNVEFAALFAPKPLGMTAADDWTKEMTTKGFPELKQLYSLFGKPENVHLTSRTEFGHNYNSVSRHAMYQWMNKHLKLGLEEPVVEKESVYLPAEELTVWNDEHPAPKGGADFERQLLQQWRKDVEKKIAADPDIARKSFDVILGRNLATAGSSEFDMTGGKEDKGDYLKMSGILRNKSYNEAVKASFYYPKDWKGGVVILLDDNAELRDKLIAAGKSVCIPGLINYEKRTVENPRESAAYTHGYNHSLFVHRLHDILTVIRFIKDDQHEAKSIDLVGSAPLAIAVRLQTGDTLDRCVVTNSDFRFLNVKSLTDENFLPGAARYGDLPAMLKLGGDENNLLRDAKSAEAVLRWLLTD